MTTLTGKQGRFVEEYVVDYNGARAARAAGYSVGRARITASENVAKSNVREGIRAAMAEKSKETELNAQFIRDELLTLYRTTDNDAVKKGLLDLGAKIEGMLTDKLEIDTTVRQRLIICGDAPTSSPAPVIEGEAAPALVSPPLLDGPCTEDKPSTSAQASTEANPPSLASPKRIGDAMQGEHERGAQ